MRTLLSLTTLLILISYNVSLGQGYVFRVLANKGQNQIQRAGKTEAEPLRTGARLQEGDMLIASQGAYIGLMHKTGRTIQVREPGEKSVNELEKQIVSSRSTVAQRYAKYVMAKINESDADVNEEYRKNLNVTGAVQRAASGASINVMLPNSVGVYNNEAIIRWSEVEDVDSYVVKLKNIFDEEIMVKETDKTNMKIDFSDETLAKEALIIFSVQAKGDDDLKSGDHGIKRLPKEKAEKITTNLDELKKDIDEDSPLNKLIYASFYEENGLVLDALTKYEEAISMNPEVSDFKLLYREFLINNNLSKE